MPCVLYLDSPNTFITVHEVSYIACVCGYCIYTVLPSLSVKIYIQSSIPTKINELSPKFIYNLVEPCYVSSMVNVCVHACVCMCILPLYSVPCHNGVCWCSTSFIKIIMEFVCSVSLFWTFLIMYMRFLCITVYEFVVIYKYRRYSISCECPNNSASLSNLLFK